MLSILVKLQIGKAISRNSNGIFSKLFSHCELVGTENLNFNFGSSTIRVGDFSFTVSKTWRLASNGNGKGEDVIFGDTFLIGDVIGAGDVNLTKSFSVVFLLVVVFNGVGGKTVGGMADEL